MLKVFDPPVDLATEFVLFELSSRPDHGGNSAKAFKTDCCIIEKMDLWMQFSIYRKSWESGKHILEEETAKLRARGDHFVQHLPMLFIIDAESGKWYPTAI